MIQNQKEENTLNPILANNLFTYGAYSLIQEGSYFRLIYTFVNQGCTEDFIKDGLTVETGIVCSSYSEASLYVNKISYMGVFQQTTLKTGAVYDSFYNKISTINWNSILSEYLDDSEEEKEKIVKH